MRASTARELITRARIDAARVDDYITELDVQVAPMENDEQVPIRIAYLAERAANEMFDLRKKMESENG